MRRVDDPEPLALAVLAPLEVAGRAHQPLEDPREVARVEDDQAHPVEDARVDPVDDRVARPRRGRRGPTRSARRSRRGPPSVRPCSGSSSVAVRTSKPPCSRRPVGDRARGSRPGRSPATGGVGALLAELVPDRDADRHAPASPGGRHGRRRRRAPTTRGSRPTGGPSAGRPRAGSGSARGRSRTARNCSQTVRDGTDRTGAARRRPARWSSRRSPQIPVRRIARSQNTRMSEPQRRDRPAAAVHRHERAGREAGHDHGPDVDRAAVVLEPGGDLGDVLAGEVGDGVEHVGPGVEQEAAAGQRRVLAPRPGASASPSPARPRR